MNCHVDALANISSSIKSNQKQTMQIELLWRKSIAEEEGSQNLGINQESNSWIELIIQYIHSGTLPSDKFETRKIRIKGSNNGRLA